MLFSFFRMLRFGYFCSIFKRSILIMRAMFSVIWIFSFSGATAAYGEACDGSTACTDTTTQECISDTCQCKTTYFRNHENTACEASKFLIKIGGGGGFIKKCPFSSISFQVIYCSFFHNTFMLQILEDNNISTNVKLITIRYIPGCTRVVTYNLIR